MHRIGFLINPIAGMGGRVGLKGTDEVEEEARRLGALPSAPARALEMLRVLKGRLSSELSPPAIEWLTASGAMGADGLAEAGFESRRILHVFREPSRREDTEAVAKRCLQENAEIIVFCGGDGTARDIASVAGKAAPLLGVPAGVKMYSGVFGITPAKTAELLLGFIEGELGTAPVEILDLDEERYRKGEWVVRLYSAALTPYEPSLTQQSKLVSASGESEVKGEIARYLREQIEAEPATLFLLGPGTTVQTVAQEFHIEKTLLGVDALVNGRLVERDLNEQGILRLLDAYARCRLILSPIGAQGFVLGRGNLQLSPAVIRRIGTDNLIVVATPAKLARISALRFDTQDHALDAELMKAGYLSVMIGYRRRRLVRAEG
jgi:predicted polyphosphate/ATP-dependent NAD kinase